MDVFEILVRRSSNFLRPSIIYDFRILSTSVLFDIYRMISGLERRNLVSVTKLLLSSIRLILLFIDVYYQYMEFDGNCGLAVQQANDDSADYSENNGKPMDPMCVLTFQTFSPFSAKFFLWTFAHLLDFISNTSILFIFTDCTVTFHPRSYKQFPLLSCPSLRPEEIEDLSRRPTVLLDNLHTNLSHHQHEHLCALKVPNHVELKFKSQSIDAGAVSREGKISSQDSSLELDDQRESPVVASSPIAQGSSREEQRAELKLKCCEEVPFNTASVPNRSQFQSSRSHQSSSRTNASSDYSGVSLVVNRGNGKPSASVPDCDVVMLALEADTQEDFTKELYSQSPTGDRLARPAGQGCHHRSRSDGKNVSGGRRLEGGGVGEAGDEGGRSRRDTVEFGFGETSPFAASRTASISNSIVLSNEIFTMALPQVLHRTDAHDRSLDPLLYGERLPFRITAPTPSPTSYGRSNSGLMRSPRHAVEIPVTTKEVTLSPSSRLSRNAGTPNWSSSKSTAVSSLVAT